VVVSYHAKFQLITTTGSRFFPTVFLEILRPPLLALFPEAGLLISGSDVRGSPQTQYLYTITCRGKFNCRWGKISCQLFAVWPWNFRCCNSYKGYYLCCTMLQQLIQPPSWYFTLSKPCERTRNGKMDNVRTHTQCKFQPERYFCPLFWSLHGRVFPEGCSCRRIPEVDYSIDSNYMEKKSGKNETKGT